MAKVPVIPKTHGFKSAPVDKAAPIPPDPAAELAADPSNPKLLAPPPSKPDANFIVCPIVEMPFVTLPMATTVGPAMAINPPIFRTLSISSSLIELNVSEKVSTAFSTFGMYLSAISNKASPSGSSAVCASRNNALLLEPNVSSCCAFTFSIASAVSS